MKMITTHSFIPFNFLLIIIKLSKSISYPDLVKFHSFMDISNSALNFITLRIPLTDLRLKEGFGGVEKRAKDKVTLQITLVVSSDFEDLCRSFSTVCSSTISPSLMELLCVCVCVCVCV